MSAEQRVLGRVARAARSAGAERAAWARPKLRPASLLPWIVPLVVAAGWEAGAALAWLPARLLPPPSVVLHTIWDLAASGDLLMHASATLNRVAAGFAFGVGAATVLGALTGYSTLGRSLFDPTIQALRNIPSIAWVPLFILWFGIFETSKVTLIAVGAFFPVYLSLSSGIRDVDRKLVEVGRIYNFSPATMIRRILLPAALPAYVVGLRSGLGLAWMFVVAAEMMGASEGLGFLLVDGQMTGRPAIIIASIVLFALVGKLTDAALLRVGARVLRWQDSFKPQG
jgi:sulfonate transport system permease protein